MANRLSGNYPSVTIGIPTYNEEEYIESVINTFQKTDYPNIVEIIIADGLSEDNTQNIVKSLSDKDSRIKLIQNPDRRQSYGLNKIIECAEGEILLRADAHAIYSRDYVSKSVKHLIKSGSKNTGGAQRFIAQNKTQAAIALVVLSPFGSGGANYRDPNYTGYVETNFLGSYWVDVLRELQGFSTNVGVNEDSDLNIRLGKKYDNAVFVAEEIKVWYYPRPTFKKLAKQYFKYGQSRALTITKHSSKVPFRVFIPGLIFLVLLSLLILNVEVFSWSVIVLSILLLVESTRLFIVNKRYLINSVWKQSRRKVPGLGLIFYLFITLLVINMSFASGLLKNLLFRDKNI